jgi:stage III sporulation protein AC
MQVDLIFRIAAVGILVAVLNTLLERSGRHEQALMVTLAGLVVVLMIVLPQLNALFEMARRMFGL